MASKPSFYYMLESPPCRTVLAVARILGVELDLKLVDLTKGDHLTPEFLKLNPFHTVPTLVDQDGYSVWESRAICTYLIESRAPQSELYPANDLKIRTAIDRVLQYDLGTVYRAISDVVYPIFKEDGKPNLGKVPRYREVLKELDQYLTGRSYTASESNWTLADISLYISLTLTEAAPETDIADFPNLVAFYKRIGEKIAQIDTDGQLAKGNDNIKAYVKTLRK